VFERNHPGRPAVFVDHYPDVAVTCAHHREQVTGRQRLGHEQRLTHDCTHVERRPRLLVHELEHVFDVDNADDVVGCALENGEALVIAVTSLMTGRNAVAMIRIGRAMISEIPSAFCSEAIFGTCSPTIMWTKVIATKPITVAAAWPLMYAVFAGRNPNSGSTR